MSVNIKYSVHDYICDVVSYCGLSCDMGKIPVSV